MFQSGIESSSNVMAHGDTREVEWRGNWRMEWVASTLHTTSEHGASSITTADAYTSAASSRLNWRPRRYKWGCPFRRKTKSSFLRVCHHISNAVYCCFATRNIHVCVCVCVCVCVFVSARSTFVTALHISQHNQGTRPSTSSAIAKDNV